MRRQAHFQTVSKLAAYQTRHFNATTAPNINDGVAVAGFSQATKAVAKDFVVDGSLTVPFGLGFCHALTIGGQYIRASLGNPNSVGNQPNTEGVAGLSYKRTTSYAGIWIDSPPAYSEPTHCLIWATYMLSTNRSTFRLAYATYLTRIRLEM